MRRRTPRVRTASSLAAERGPFPRRSRMSRMRRGPSDRGAAVVEFALLAPVFVLLVMGIVDFGVGISNNIAIRQGVREGVRQGAVGTFGSNSSCTLTGVSGAPADTKALMCLAKTRIGGDFSKTRVKVELVGDYVRGSAMRVCAQRPWE